MNKLLDNYLSKEINEKINLINRYIKRNNCSQIPGFNGLIKITNNDRDTEQKLIGNINHIWTILLLKSNDCISIESVNKKYKSTTPDIIFQYKNEKYL